MTGGIFALAKPNDRLLVPLLQAIPAERRPAFRRCLELLGTRLTGWVKGQLISMATIGVLATGAFYLIGVPYALLHLTRAAHVLGEQHLVAVIAEHVVQLLPRFGERLGLAAEQFQRIGRDGFRGVPQAPARLAHGVQLLRRRG